MNIVFCTFEDSFRGTSIRYLSSYIKSLGHTSRMLFLCRGRARFDNDLSFTDEEVKSIGRFLDENGIGLVGFSIMTGHFLQSIDLMRKLKKNSKKIKFIFGGVHPTILPEECLTAGADYAVMGDGEIPLRRLLAEEPVYKIAGLCYVDNGKPVVNPADHENLIPLDKLPFPDYDFSDSYFLDKASVKQLDIKTYRDRTTWAGEYYYLTTTRGCPYHCAYCCNVNRHSLRRNTVDRVIEELNEVKENMPFICGINIQDDSFFMGSDAWLADFCSRIKKQFDWPFMARLMPRFITEDRIKILRDGGLEHVSIGLQGSDRLNSELYSRQEDSQSFINACKTIGNFGILPVVDVIMDNPYETETDLKEITKILNSIPKPFTVLTYSLTLFPSTDIYNKARLDGIDKKFGTDAYKSAVIASRSGGYVTPLVWRRLIETVVSQAPSGVIKDILDRGVSGKKNVAKINKLYRRYSFRVKFVNRLRNFNPLLFRILLKIYRAWQKIKI